MGLFTKTNCSLCGAKASKKLINGFICNDCISKCNKIINLSFQKYSVQEATEAVQLQNDYNNRISIFSPTKNIDKYIEFDANNKLFKVKHQPFIFSYDEIMNFELVENGNTITTGGLGSAIAGGLAFGSVGAVVGGIVGKKVLQQEINEYGIRITTNRPLLNIIYINLLLGGKVNSGSTLHKSYSASAQNIMYELSSITNLK